MLTPVGKIGETRTVVFGDNIPICSILCLKSSYVLCTSVKIATPYAIEIINPNMYLNFGMANAHTGVNILNEIRRDPMAASIGEFDILSITVTYH